MTQCCAGILGIFRKQSSFLGIPCWGHRAMQTCFALGSGIPGNLEKVLQKPANPLDPWLLPGSVGSGVAMQVLLCLPRARRGAALWSLELCWLLPPPSWPCPSLSLADNFAVSAPTLCSLPAELGAALLLPWPSPSATCLCLDKPRNEALRAGACQAGTCHPQGQLGTSCHGEAHFEHTKQVHEPLVTSNPLQWNQDGAQQCKSM